MKKFSIFLIFIFTLISTNNVFAINASLSEQNIKLDGDKIYVEGYNIEGNNYFRLRDVAAILNNSSVQFNVIFNKETSTVEIERKSPYSKLENDLKSRKKEKLEISKSFQKVTVDSEKIVFNGYLINGNNYFKLRDLGKTIGFYVDYDDESNSVIIKTQSVTPSDLIKRTPVKFISLASDLDKNRSEISMKDKLNLSINDFLSNVESVVLLTSKQTQLSANAEYDIENNLIVLSPKQLKYKGQLNFNPVLKIEDGSNENYISLKSSNIDLEDISKNLASNNFKLVLGYYVGENESQNFRAFSIIEVTK